MAVGLAHTLAFPLPANFNMPYFAANIGEFWRRWHISLSSWLRDYLYIPLGGSAGGHLTTARNVMTTMLVAGFWHGANWTFIVFGAIHGGVMIVERLLFGTSERAGGARSVPSQAGFFSLWTQRILTFNLFCFTLV